MKIINTPRGSGKTTFLIFYSALTKQTIITSSEVAKKYIKIKSSKLKLNIPEPITMFDIIFNKSKENYNYQGYLIDNYEIVSAYLIESLLHNKVDLAMTTIENIEGD